MGRTKIFDEKQKQRTVYVSDSDVEWLKDNRYSLTEIVRQKIKELRNE